MNHDAEHVPHTANEERDPHTANEERDPHTAPADSELEKFRQEKGTPTITTFSSSVYPQFQFRTMLPMKDQDIPVIVTVYPDIQNGHVEVDEKLARELKRF